MAIGDWRVDDTMRRGQGQGGSAPDGHPRRCQAKTRTGVQCPQWALKEVNYCKVHGGRHRQRSKNVVPRPHFYRGRAGKRLDDIIADAAAAPMDERKSLLAEIDVARALVGEGLKLFGDVTDGPLKDVANDAVRMQVAGHVRASLDQVQRLVSALAKAEALAPDRLNADQIKSYADKLSGILHKHFEGDPRLTLVFDEMDAIPIPAADRPVVTISID